jgi:hypothetical protein
MSDTPEKPELPERPIPGVSGQEGAAGIPPDRLSPSSGAPAPAGAGPAYTPPPPKRTSAQIRADIDAQRAELGQSVDQLRDRVTELTDWKSQLRKHRKQIIVGAVATGFVVGGLMALRRR